MIGKIALVAAVASEGLAFYTVAEWFAAGYREGQHDAIPGVAFALLALLAFFTPRLVQWLELRPRPSAAILAAVAYVAMYGLLRVQFAHDFALWDLAWIADFVRDPGATMEDRAPVLVGALLVIAIWARSAFRSATDIELEALPRSVTLPFVVVTAVVILSVYTERSGEVARAGASYYVVAVLSLALGQLSMSGASFGDVRAGGTVATLLLATGGAAIACVAVFWLVFGLVGPTVGPYLETALFYSLTIILTPIAWVMDKIFTFLLGDVAGLESFEFPNANVLQETAEQDPGEEPGAVQRGGIYLTRILMLVAVLGGLALIVAWFTRLRRRANRPTADGEPAGIAGALQDDMRNVLGSLFRRPRRGAHAEGSTAARRLYMEMLSRAESQGISRAADETPNEIAPRLSGALHTPLTDEITAAFLQSRYAGREPDPRLIDDLERRWKAAPPRAGA